jgi:hypothetical protein
MFLRGEASKTRVWLVFLLSLIGMTLIPIFEDMVYDNSRLLQAMQHIQNTPHARLSIWQGALNAALSTHPWIGNGMGTFKDVYLQYRLPGDPASGFHAHNDSLHILVELGALGVMLFGVLVGYLVRLLYGVCKHRDQVHILPAALVIFCIGMAMVTPVILLPCVSIVLGVAILDLRSLRVDQKVISVPKIAQQILILFFVALGCLTVQSGLERYSLFKMNEALFKGDLAGFVGGIDQVDQWSFGVNPGVPIMRASTLLGLYDTYMIDDEKRPYALDEVEGYLKQAKNRSPYNPEILFYEGEVALRRGDEKAAREKWQSVLAIDPRYLRARMRLASLIKDEEERYVLLRDGVAYRYWKQDPKTFYKALLPMAQNRDDDDVVEYLNQHMAW